MRYFKWRPGLTAIIALLVLMTNLACTAIAQTIQEFPTPEGLSSSPYGITTDRMGLSGSQRMAEGGSPDHNIRHIHRTQGPLYGGAFSVGHRSRAGRCALVHSLQQDRSDHNCWVDNCVCGSHTDCSARGYRVVSWTPKMRQ